jgi:hypothetical protein
MIVCRTMCQNEFETMLYFTRVIKVDRVGVEPTTSARVNFVRMYDSSNTLIEERLLAYERIFAKYGKKQNLVLRATKEIEHY